MVSAGNAVDGPAAQYLLAEKVTEPRRLAISGRSNGGLLVGAAMTQRPELFGAVINRGGDTRLS